MGSEMCIRDSIGSSTFSLAVTVLVVIVMINAVNFVDGLDGLVAGVAIIANSVFFIYTQLLVAETGVDPSISLAALIAAIVVGIAAGFLPFNWHRAKMFMGDTGALLIGLLMATSTVSVTGLGAAGEVLSSGTVKIGAGCGWRGAVGGLIDGGLPATVTQVRLVSDADLYGIESVSENGRMEILPVMGRN